MNSRWQSDNPVRSIGEYLPLRQRCTHAALTHRNTRPMYAKHSYIIHGAEHAYVSSGMRRVRVCRFIRSCSRLYACVARARIRGPHIGRSVCRRDFANGRRQAHALCMNACTYTRWTVLDLFPAELRDTYRRERNARGRAERALRRESTDSARPRGLPKGLSKDRIFSISVKECVL